MSSQCEKCGRPVSNGERYCAMCSPMYMTGEAADNKPLYVEHSKNELSKQIEQLIYIQRETQHSISFIKNIMIVSLIVSAVSIVIAFFPR